MVGPDGLLVCCLYRTHSCADISSKSFWYHFMSRYTHLEAGSGYSSTVSEHMTQQRSIHLSAANKPITPARWYTAPQFYQYNTRVYKTPLIPPEISIRIRISESTNREQIIITGDELIDHWAERSITDRDAVRFQGDLVCLGFNLLD